MEINTPLIRCNYFDLKNISEVILDVREISYIELLENFNFIIQLKDGRAFGTKFSDISEDDIEVVISNDKQMKDIEKEWKFLEDEMQEALDNFDILKTDLDDGGFHKGHFNNLETAEEKENFLVAVKSSYEFDLRRKIESKEKHLDEIREDRRRTIINNLTNVEAERRVKLYENIYKVWKKYCLKKS